MSFTRQASTSNIMAVKRNWDDAENAPVASPSSSFSTSNKPTPRPSQTPEQKEEARRRRMMMIQSQLGDPAVTPAKRPSDASELDSRDPKRVGSVSSGSKDVVTSDTATDKKPATISISAKIVLSSEQQEILKLVTNGKNIFFTGSAGTGKSVLLREIIKALRKKHIRSPDAVAITASTGMAACNIGGVTLHSFAGIGLGIESAEHLANKVKKQKKSASRWMRTQVLIIDEISMVDGDLFDKLARIACLLRKTTKPFGGIQLVVCGDFFQLPPVTKGSVPRFAFEASMWSDCVERTFNLTKVFRQKEQEFVDMLNEMRFGTLTSTSVRKFQSLSRSLDSRDGIEPTELFPLREQVEQSNDRRLKGLEGEVHTYTAMDGGSAEPEAREKLLTNMMAPKRIQMKINTQVMLIKNTDETLVNGSVGKVLGFYDQGTYNKMLVGMGEEPQAPTEDTKKSSASSSKKKEKETNGSAGQPVYPLVRFPIVGGGFRDVLIVPESWKVELPNGEVQASRTQLPLILAWAMSIHKSQGQTLPKVKVDLSKVFEKGQAYVALSRATSLEGLQVLGFNKDKVMAHPKVVIWSKTLETIN